MNARRIFVACLLVPAVLCLAPAVPRGRAVPVTIQVDAGASRGRAAADLAVLRRRRAELRVHEGRPQAARGARPARAAAGLLPHPQPAHHRRRHARAQVGQHERLHRRRRRASPSTTGRSSTASSTRTWSAGVKPYAQIGFMPAGALRQAGAVPARVAARACPTTTSTPAGPIRRRTTRSGPSWSSSGSSTASSGTAAPKSRTGTGRSGTSPTSATGRARRRSSTSSTTTPIDAVRRALPTARVGGPDTAGGGEPFLRDFLEHCLRGTNHATGETGTPLDFIAFHAKGAPQVRRRPRADGHRRASCRRSTRRSRSSRRSPS